MFFSHFEKQIHQGKKEHKSDRYQIYYQSKVKFNIIGFKEWKVWWMEKIWCFISKKHTNLWMKTSYHVSIKVPNWKKRVIGMRWLIGSINLAGLVSLLVYCIFLCTSFTLIGQGSFLGGVWVHGELCFSLQTAQPDKKLLLICEHAHGFPE